MSKKITVKQILDAVRKNGKPKLKNMYYQYKNGEEYSLTTNDRRLNRELIGGCAMGQAAENLDVSALNLEDALFQAGIKTVYGRSIGQAIRVLNDETSMTLPEIADQIEKELLTEDLKKAVVVN